jgi:hypothetical protein
LSESAKTGRIPLDSVAELRRAPITTGSYSLSEAIQHEQAPYPGEAWTEIVRRPFFTTISKVGNRLGIAILRTVHVTAVGVS